MNTYFSLLNTMQKIYALKIQLLFVIACFVNFSKLIAQKPDSLPHRPQFHFSPKENWMNDPNGLVYYKGEYHLFFQYYPNATVWGPMHWGHAVSKDLIHWEQLPIALYPDSLGLIFSGSIVIDSLNTSGLKSGEEAPMIAIFTYHDLVKEKNDSLNCQFQGMAYSNDKGRTWKKYATNPILKNGLFKDFRDPNVFWYAPKSKWMMTLAVGDHVEFYTSKDLKGWTKTGEFGKNEGSHGGVWECPSLIKIKIEGTKKEKWVLIQSIGRGGPIDGGSATQYFIGTFDGLTFKNENTNEKILWLDHGSDNYAAVVFCNAPDNKQILLGWMSNWLYATKVPTEKWRSAMTLPRELKLKNTENGLRLFQEPVKAFKELRKKQVFMQDGSINKKDTIKVIRNSKLNEIYLEITPNKSKSESFSIVASNNVGEQLEIGYNAESRSYYIDRTKSGNVNFEKSFSSVALAPRTSTNSEIKLHIFLDVASVEVFCDDGETVMTDIFFPTEDFSKIDLVGNKKLFRKIKTNGEKIETLNKFYELKN